MLQYLKPKPSWSVRSLLPTSTVHSSGVITKDELSHLSKLSNLHFSPEKLEVLTKDVNDLCHLVGKIQEVEVGEVEPLIRLTPEKTVSFQVTRPEEALYSKEVKGRGLLRHAKELYGNYYVVRQASSNQ
ncbi:hypothetical protein K493DRAFT_315855 [Basidiobolus meristosporus CBS 931.73]|uniref:Uncharacterized protein n=1 Tax=Basidiobolus meristosporus CBS 931.73 TaxID=1314790 RepID=A0A1Y1Y6W6_9FUNG|nr:hypothetical protein K493DRAFT_315855 [Basidiobolus meristosporus CBS 931.73]|eukprot:ORX93752.1 hypothetical protein K493DRAFT_315855 [Basidiobolus meristosporus CBS 931.73]